MTTLDSKDLESVLKFIKDRWGAEVFINSERVAGLLGDLAPELRNERAMVVRLSKNGILSDFIKNSHADAETKKRLIAKFSVILIESEYVIENVAEKYLKIMASVFDWEIEVSVKNSIADKSASMQQIERANGDGSPLLRRAFIFLEDGDYSNAEEYFERTLDHDPENAWAYLGKLMVEMRIPRQSDLQNCKYPFSSNKNYQKALRYGEKELSEFLQKTNDYIQRRNEDECLLALYKEAESAKYSAFDEKTFRAAGRKFQVIEGYKDAKEQAKECFLKAQAYSEYERDWQKKQKYEVAKKTMNNACNEETFNDAGELFRNLQGYRDADLRAKECFRKAQECAEKERQGIKYNCAMYYMNKACNEEAFKKAGELFKKAGELFKKAKGYQDADSRTQECFQKAKECAEKERQQPLQNTYDTAMQAMNKACNEETFKNAGELFRKVQGYRDADSRTIECFKKAEECAEKERQQQLQITYDTAMQAMNKACDEEAFKNTGELFRQVQGYRDADSRTIECFKKAEECAEKERQQQLQITYDTAMQAMNKACDEETFKNAGELFRKMQGYCDADELAKQCFDKAELCRREVIEEKRRKRKRKILYAVCPLVASIVIVCIFMAANYFIKKKDYQVATEKFEAGAYEEAMTIYKSLGGFLDSEDKTNEIKEILLNSYLKNKREELRSVSIGDSIFLGRYGFDIKMEWTVIEKINGKILVISKDVIDCIRYNETLEIVSWKESTLRKWLNKDFFNAAFSNEEKYLISQAEVDLNRADKEKENAESLDRVFLLNMKEINKYLKSEEERKCDMTTYARNRGAFGPWWVRSSGSNMGVLISLGGAILSDNYPVNYGHGGVRPAMWIVLE